MEPDARDGLAALWTELSLLEAPIMEMFELAVAATRKPTPAQQRQLAQGHRRIVRKRAEIESASLGLLKLSLLPARAIRQVACAIEIAAELERIAYLLRHMVRSPLLTHGSTSQQTGAALATALTASQECVALVLSGLAAHDTNNHPSLLTARGRAEAQFALVYDWMADDSTRAAARPYLRRQLMQLAQHHRELFNRILSLNEWISFSSSRNAPDEPQAVRQADLSAKHDKEPTT